MTVCYWCQVSLHFVAGEGWVHQDGNKIRTEVGLDGKRRVEHWAQPVAEPTAVEREKAPGYVDLYTS